MQGQPSGPLEPSRLRISDEDRHQVAEVLRQAAGDGRIDLDELDERLEATYAAKTYAELAPITFDLPAHAVQHAPAVRRPARVVPGPGHERGIAVMSGIERKGVWVVPEHYTLFTLMGGAELDMREAKFSAPEVVITVNSLMGGAEIIVDPHTHVVIEGIGIMGAFVGPGRNDEAELDETSPVVRVNGIAIMGGVSVSRKPRRGERLRRLDR